MSGVMSALPTVAVFLVLFGALAAAVAWSDRR